MTGGVQPRNAGLVQARARRASGRKASAGKARGWAERSGKRRAKSESPSEWARWRAIG